MSDPSTNQRFCCPIHLGLMTEPCTTPCGHTFDRSSLQNLLIPRIPSYVNLYYENSTMSASVHCPTCRAVIPNSWNPVVNYDLKGIIDDAVVAFTGSQSQSQSQIPVQTVFPSVTPKVTAEIAGPHVHIQVSVPADAKPLPLNIITVLDMSGSMGSRATEPKVLAPGEKAEESALMSRMDLTGHSVKALAKTLKPTDYLSIIGFDNEAVTYLPPTAMTVQGQDLAVAKVSQIKPRGGTSFWAGISAAFKALESYSGANNVIIFQTDGESDPSYDPPLGLLKSIDAWKDRHPDIKFSLHTIGYGYGEALQSELLRQIASKCGGDFYYVPDGSILAQVAIHLIANLSAITHTDVTLRLTGFERSYIPVGFLQAGQTRDFILSGQENAVVRLFVKGDEVATTNVKVSTTPSEMNNALAHNIFVEILGSALASGRLDIDRLKLGLHSLPSSDYITALLTDLEHTDKYKGQISKAFIPENFRKWGKHYLPGVLSGHRNKWPMNFKDECSTFYKTQVTDAAVTQSVEIYETLPAIKATYSASASASASAGYASVPVYVAPQVVGGGGCFTGDTMVLSANGPKRIDSIRAGDLLMDPVKGDNRVVCVVRYDVTKEQAIVRLGSAGLTEFHPVWDHGTWVHPRTIATPSMESVNYVYNLVLESGHSIILLESEEPGDWRVACTLAHTFEGPVISHSYFGAPVPGKPHCLEDLKMSPGWNDGYVICYNTKEIRDESGEIIRLMCDYA